MSTLTVAASSSVTQTNGANENKKSNKTDNTTQTKQLGATDTLDTEKNGVKLTPILYEIKDRDTLMKIANELGLKLTDLVDQLKKSGQLPQDYDPSAKHGKDIPWMKAGNKIKLAYPATKEQKVAYEEFCEKRTKEYYNKKAEAKKAADAEALAKQRADYDALPWYSKIGKKRP